MYNALLLFFLFGDISSWFYLNDKDNFSTANWLEIDWKLVSSL